MCSDQITCKCILESEINSVLHFRHSTSGGGHYGSMRTNRKVLDCGLYWPTLALISDQGSHFYNRTMVALLAKYGVVHWIATTYHHQTNNQAEFFNKEIKQLLQKIANPNRND
ncbi:hypothetical protein CR513_34985, partial [Mucuna pruriens]